MLNLLEDLPVELVGVNVLAYLSLKDFVMLERACGSKKSHQAFKEQIQNCPSVILPSSKHNNMSVLEWFKERDYKISFLTTTLPGNNPGLYVKNIQVGYINLKVHSNATTECLKPFLENNMGCKVNSILLIGEQNKDVMEQLSACTGNVKHLYIRNSYNCKDWLTADILSKWKLTEITLNRYFLTTPSFILIIVQTCTELTSIKLYSTSVDDAAVIAIAQHCPKLETLLLRSSNITWTSLLALSERGLPLEELDIAFIPNIPTADIAGRCSHALSCIRYLSTYELYENGQDANILISYMTGLIRMYLNYKCDSYIPLLTQHCHKLNKIDLRDIDYTVTDILSLCRANPLLQDLRINARIFLTDTELIELIHACPQLHTLYLPNEIDITDIGILALSEHCHQLQVLSINKCHKVTETAVIQLLRRCRKLIRLDVSSSSLSEETWTQLDKNTQKRVSRW